MLSASDRGTQRNGAAWYLLFSQDIRFIMLMYRSVGKSVLNNCGGCCTISVETGRYPV